MAQVPPQTRTARNDLPFLIRSAQHDDAVAMLTYVRTVARETPFFMIEADEFNFPEEQERKWIQDHLDRPGWLVLLAESSGTIIGLLSSENGLYRRCAHRGNFGISVAESWRGQGVGSALLKTFLHWATENPIIEKIGMDVFATNEDAIRFYKKFGFVKEGLKLKEIKLGNGQYVDTVSMTRFVR